MTDTNEAGRLCFSMYRNGEAVGLLARVDISQTVADVDSLKNYLNFFSSVLHAAGFHYERVGVTYTLSDGEEGEHWSDY